MDEYIKTTIDDTTSHVSKYNPNTSDKDILTVALSGIVSDGINGDIKLAEAYPKFCEYVSKHYKKVDLLDILDNSYNSMSFDYYSDDAPDTIITFMICFINHSWDTGYSYNCGDGRDRLKILSREKCNISINIFSCGQKRMFLSSRIFQIYKTNLTITISI